MATVLSYLRLHRKLLLVGLLHPRAHVAAPAVWIGAGVCAIVDAVLVFATLDLALPRSCRISEAHVV